MSATPQLPAELTPLAKSHYHPATIELVKQTVARGATNTEIAHLLHLAATYGLDPLQQEIWLVERLNPRSGQPERTVLTSRDGYLKFAQQQPDFLGLLSFEVREGDDFEVIAADYTVRHKFGAGPRGPILGAWARCDRDGHRPYIAYAALEEYQDDTRIWGQYPSAMIRKVAEAMVLKRAFGIHGLCTREELGSQLQHRQRLQRVQRSQSRPALRTYYQQLRLEQAQNNELRQAARTRYQNLQPDPPSTERALQEEEQLHQRLPDTPIDSFREQEAPAPLPDALA